MLGKITIWITGILCGAALLRGAARAQGATRNSRQADLAAAQVAELAPVSLQLVDGAIAVLGKGWSGMNADEKALFLQLYDPAGTGEVDEQFVAEVRDNYCKIRDVLAAGVPVIYGGPGSICRDQRLYYTDMIRVYVCPYFFTEMNDWRRARTLIHEHAHIALLVLDRPYYRSTSPAYARLTPNGSWATRLPLVGRVIRELLRGDTLYHPDAYAHFALLNTGYTYVEKPQITMNSAS